MIKKKNNYFLKIAKNFATLRNRGSFNFIK